LSPGSGRRYRPSTAHASAALRMVPSPPSTINTSSFSPAASANEGSILSAPPLHILGSAMPAPLSSASIFASDSESHPPLDVLIMTPTLYSDKRIEFNSICQYSRQDIFVPICPGSRTNFLRSDQQENFNKLIDNRSRRESNPHLRFRKPPFYPLNYGNNILNFKHLC
jgi:hypothetical protein